MTRRDSLQCIHEPFGDAFYFGPERLSARYENDKEARVASGFSTSTYKSIFDRIESEASEVCRSAFLALLGSPACQAALTKMRISAWSHYQQLLAVLSHRL